MIRFLAALVLLLGFVGTVHAAAEHPDQGSAYADCLVDARAQVQAQPTMRKDPECRLEGQRAYRAYFKACAWHNHEPPCSDAIGGYHEWPAGKNCTDRTGDGDGPSSQNGLLVGTAVACHNGCSYAPTLGEGMAEWSFSAGQTVRWIAGGEWVPSGEVCDSSAGENPDPQDDYCATVGNLTQCLQNDGRHCAVSKSGKRFCWKPEETGTKVSGNEASTKSPQGVGINPPPVPPKNNGQWEQTGSGTASVSSGGVTNNYNVTNNTSNYGPDGQGGGAEGDGDGGGDGGGDEGEDPYGDAGEGVGTFYERTDKTVGSLLTDFYGQVSNTPFVDAITQFMQADGGGSCPTFTLPGNDFWDAQIFDAHCSGTFLAMLQAMGWVVLAMAAYIAIKIAVT